MKFSATFAFVLCAISTVCATTGNIRTYYNENCSGTSPYAFTLQDNQSCHLLYGASSLGTDLVSPNYLEIYYTTDCTGTTTIMDFDGNDDCIEGNTSNQWYSAKLVAN
ncbi:hypothetical protein BT96DRAFT_1021306 [Gymnopus androsaceus JB14]|uniref:Uncharacterized protein n=1 Tax=Gymnopus androsaceus JB14 TaxID=1447944 RepID=A0A6A4HHY5_9AGAR|nr:hypothetical protein BT96DRAFT_1021306 [Gymnopus androsaceus JB14]